MRTRLHTRYMSVRATSHEPAHFTPHAATRWAHLVAGVLTSPVDLRTLEAWGRRIAVSRGTLKTWCEIAGVSPRRSLLLGRILRAVEHRRRGTSFENSLDIRDRRTFRKLFDVAGHHHAAPQLGDLPIIQRGLVDLHSGYCSRTLTHREPRQVSDPPCSGRCTS